MKKTILTLLCLLTVGVSTSWAQQIIHKIYTLADLELFRDNVFSGEKNYENETVMLMNDIDASAASWNYGIGKLQANSGDSDNALNPFMGIFDGQGYKITGLTINSQDGQQSGFFMSIKNATVKNLNLVNCVIKGAGHRVAGITARAESSTIQNCSVKDCTIECTAAEVTDQSIIGGIAGTITGTTIIGCAVNNCTIDGKTRGGNGTLYCNGAGGIVGRVNGDNTIKNNTVYGGTKIYGKAIGVGAIIGEPGAGTVTLGCTGNSYSTDVEVRYYDITNNRWVKVDDNGTSYGDGTTWTLADATKKVRGYYLRDYSLTEAEHSGISQATINIASALVELKVGTNVQTWKTYDGTAMTPDDVVVTLGGNRTEDTDYTVTYENMKEPGVYPQGVKITGMGSYYGFIYADFTVCKSIDPTKTPTAAEITTDPESAAAKPLPSRKWAATLLPTEFSVYDGDTQLVENTDYKLFYTYGTVVNGTTAPTGGTTDVPDNAKTKVTVTIKGVGIYSESFVRDYYILPATINDITTGEDGDIQYGIIDKTNTVTVTGYKGTTEGKDVTVPETMSPIAGLTLGVVGVDALTSNATLTPNPTYINGVTLPSTITDIKDGAFGNATNLHWIDASEATGFVPTTLSRTAAAAPFSGVNKRALIFLNGSTIEGENYIYKVATDNYQCDVLKIYDDAAGDQKGFEGADDTEKAFNAKWGFQNPIAFTANTVTNTRKLNATVENKQQGYTICLPYAIPQSDKFKAYELKYSKDNQVGFEELTGAITATRPFVIIPSESGQLLSTTDATIVQTYDKTTTNKYVTLPTFRSEAVSTQQQYDMQGTMKYLSGQAGMYILQKNNVWANETDPAGQYEYPKMCVLPMRAYIMAYTPDPARLFSTFNNADGSTTAIEGLQIDANDKAEVYDLQGRKVSAPQRNGLYIVNGKKVVMK